METARNTQLQVYITEAHKKWLFKQAEKNGVSVSKYVDEAIKHMAKTNVTILTTVKEAAKPTAKTKAVKPVVKPAAKKVVRKPAATSTTKVLH